ncbi:Uncharacterized protein Fot_03733 [Forsythia ovata]|uniref:Uncharacterized protein n=1 Tax=Forsythia ovata TaxID=205694 RepID=A0ABD1XAN8_9LAMI
MRKSLSACKLMGYDVTKPALTGSLISLFKIESKRIATKEPIPKWEMLGRRSTSPKMERLAAEEPIFKWERLYSRRAVSQAGEAYCGRVYSQVGEWDRLCSRSESPKLEKLAAEEPILKWKRLGSRSESPKLEKLAAKKSSTKWERLGGRSESPKLKKLAAGRA